MYAILFTNYFIPVIRLRSTRFCVNLLYFFTRSIKEEIFTRVLGFIKDLRGDCYMATAYIPWQQGIPNELFCKLVTAALWLGPLLGLILRSFNLEIKVEYCIKSCSRKTRPIKSNDFRNREYQDQSMFWYTDDFCLGERAGLWDKICFQYIMAKTIITTIFYI